MSATPPAFEALRAWFVDQAVPLWSRYGVDRRYGGFFERLDPNLIPTAEPRRARLVARQIYTFCIAESFGWQGPADELINHGFHFLSRHLLNPQGVVCASCTAAGQLLDSRQYLYDVAFVLLALAKQFKRQPDCSASEDLARRIVMRLSLNPVGGYIELSSPGLQCANPHMHLFEAFLTWTIVSDCEDGFWMQRAGSLAELATEHMVQPHHGLIPEHYEQSWRPVRHGGNFRIEPGHQFEWSWLLATWASITGDSSASAAASHLCRVAEEHGVDPIRDVAFECIDNSLTPVDCTARLWQQTERLKAWHQQAQLHGLSTYTRQRDQALDSLLHFLSGPKDGLWFDEMDTSGNFVSLPVKASSGYHIACAIEVIFNRFSCH